MKTKIALFILIALVLPVLIQSCGKNAGTWSLDTSLLDSARVKILFDEGWRFHRGDIAGVEQPGFNDSGWRLLDLPHDWSIEDLPGRESPIDSNAIGGIDAGYLVGGTGWYRKDFIVPADLKGKQVMIQFDGVYMNSDIWLNGRHLTNRPYGYSSFRYFITPYLKPGEKNTIAVQVKNEGRNSRWYSGSGIYRHVWLHIFNEVHADPWELTIRTPVIDSVSPKVEILASFFNESKSPRKVKAVIEITDPHKINTGNAERTFTIQPGSSYYYNASVQVNDLHLWTPNTPELYFAEIKLFTIDGEGKESLSDKLTTRFGFRTVEVDPQKGFLLNGKTVLLKGGCIHHDNGPLGAAAFDRAEERRIELMKASGFNAIRSSHNPPSPVLLDACDRLGMMVIDESFDMWREPKNPDDYHKWFDEWWRRDLENMIRRDINHPSVIMWSIGNEIPERGKPEGARLAARMRSSIEMFDRTRPVTSAVNSLGPDKDPFFRMFNVTGYNYAVDHYVKDHERMPDRIILSTESFPLEAFDYWMAVKDYPWVIGDFVWTGFDYLGEASIGWLGYPHEGSFYPWTHAYCGDIDICGFKRPQSYYRDILWENGKSVAVFVKPPVPSFPLNPKKAEWSKWEWQDVVASWNWEGFEGTPLEVEIYSSCEEVELFINGNSLGRRKTDRSTKFMTKTHIAYEPGTLAVKGYSGGKEVASAELKSASKPERITLSADRQVIKADGQDLCYITVELVDRDGTRNPKAGDLVKFSVDGPASIAAVGSSNPFGTESFRKPFRNAWQGRCLVILRSGKKEGKVKLKAEAEGIEGAEIEISTH